MCLVCSSSYAQSQASQPGPAGKPKQDSCKSARAESYAQGWKDGSDAERKSSYQAGFNAAFDVASSVFSVKLGEVGSKQKVNILVEDIDGADSYRLAAAEIVKTHFADWLEVDAQAPLTLHIGGTKSMQLNYNSDVQSISAEISIFARQSLTVGDDRRLIAGRLQLADAGSTLRGYSPQEKAQAVREMIYKVVSDYKEEWDKANSKTQ
jgi:hypothetical protein